METPYFSGIPAPNTPSSPAYLGFLTGPFPGSPPRLGFGP
jgi:hypothetical protein